MHPEEEKQLKIFEYTDQLFKKYIAPDNKVVSIGPSSSFTSDPTLLLALRLAKNGKVFAADPKFAWKWSERASRKAGPSDSGGIGGISGYQEDIDFLNNLGIEVPKLKWLGYDSGVYNIPTQNADLIIDHAHLPLCLNKSYQRKA